MLASDKGCVSAILKIKDRTLTSDTDIEADNRDKRVTKKIRNDRRCFAHSQTEQGVQNVNNRKINTSLRESTVSLRLGSNLYNELA